MISSQLSEGGWDVLPTDNWLRKTFAKMIYTITLSPGLDRTLTVGSIRENEVLRAAATPAHAPPSA